MTPEQIAELLTALAGMTAEERATRLAELTPEDLTALAEAAQAAGAAADTAGDIDGMNSAAEVLEAVAVENTQRQEQQAEADAQAETARERLRNAIPAQAEGETADGDAGDGDGGQDGDATGDGEQAGEVQTEQQPEAVAASARRRPADLGRLARRAPAVARPASHGNTRGTARVTLKAKGAGVTYRPDMASLDDMAEATAEVLQRLVPGSDTPTLIASIETSYSEDRFLKGPESENNTRKLDAVTSVEARVAAGGLCAPAQVDYTVETLGVADRPIRAALPNFGATRGAVSFRTPPSLGDVADPTVWTVANDVAAASDGTVKKPRIRIGCLTGPTTATVDAVPLYLEFGNLQARFDPEGVRAFTDIAMVGYARFAENRLLTQIRSLSRLYTTPEHLGASRDVLAALDLAIAAMKYKHRVSDNQVLRAIYPRWLKDALRADVARQVATDASTTDGGALAVADRQIEAFFAVRNINPVWHLDGSDSTARPAVQTNDFNATAVALQPFPAKVNWLLYPEGAFSYLDGGRLDFGVLRDAALTDQNDYVTFMEEFFTVARRGVDSWHVQSTIAVNGKSSGPITLTDPTTA